MSSQHDPLEPTPFEPATPSRSQQEETSQVREKSSPGWVIPALGGLLVLAAIVLFWLPERVAQQAPADITSPSSAPPSDSGDRPTATVPQAAPGTESASPWSEAQAAKLREEAQQVLQELLDVQFSLEEREVEQWAPDPFSAAVELAAAGDELYKNREFEAATARYQDSLQAFRDLEQSIPEQLEQQLEAARQGIEAGDTEAAANALATATLIEASAPELPGLEKRLENLPQVIDLLQQAADAETAGDLPTAERLLRQTTAVDPAHLGAGAQLERVVAAHLEQRFNDAMSEGYLALDERRFNAARKAFRSAAQLQKDSREAASALQEVAAAETAAQLSSLKRQGANHEAKEQWQQAVAAYEQAQGIDASVLFASEGLERSRGRAQLDARLRKAIDQPQRLSDLSVAKETDRLVATASRIEPRGSVLARQLEELQMLLQQANTPVTVTLRSDMETEVTVYKVAKLGRFQERELSLRPGTYTAVGSRVGYRDVRQEIVVLHNAVPSPVTIVCVEKI